jgi:DNA-binding LytR/AlgR family response regulator
MKLNCLVVDDEPIAQQILQNYILQIEALQFVGNCSNAFEALNILHQEPIDVMFLDIKMPSLSGLDMLKTLHNPPKVILTTAFSEFGVESYEYGITDYLLKPIAFDRFLKAVNKILIPSNIEFPVEKKQAIPSAASEFIFFKADKKIHKLYCKEILFFEGCGNYVKIHRDNNAPTLMILDKLSDLENKLSKDTFIRVHKSFIVNTYHIQVMEGNLLKLKDKTVTISHTYKQNIERLTGN